MLRKGHEISNLSLFHGQLNFCRACGSDEIALLIDLGLTPISNELIDESRLELPETFYPLRALTCHQCGFVQLSITISPQLLFNSEYVYFSSYSNSWLKHCQEFADDMIKRFKLSQNDFVVEIASNDGYLLRYFLERNIKVLGIEPAESVATVAQTAGIPTLINFFTCELAESLKSFQKPKLIVANNVLAHVPDIRDFIRACSILLDDDGILSFEFPHLQNLLKYNQFDTIYHEHYSYLSLKSISPLLQEFGLKIFDVEKIGTHGGSLRILATKENVSIHASMRVVSLISEEQTSDPRDPQIIRLFRNRVTKVRADLVQELTNAKLANLRVAAYGAAAKGNTLLNYCGITRELISYVVDQNPAKQGKFLPGTRIPIVPLSKLRENPPDILLILPWNLSNEIIEIVHHQGLKEIKFLRAIPNVEYLTS